MNVKPWIEAARLRTLPLALSSIIMGTACALHFGYFNWAITVLATTTTILLQILSNYANDYGDALSGKDNDGRIGPKRSVSSGDISPSQMKKALILFSLLSLLSGLTLLFITFKNALYISIFLILGLASIAAAIKYTVGKNPYGYNGFGDLFVFIFFGLVGVMGTYFLYSKSFNVVVLLPAATIGLLSMAVLNLNNMRDIDNDEKTGKHTLAVIMGLKKAKQYEYLTIVIAFGCLILFCILEEFMLKQYLFLILTPFFAQMIKKFLIIFKPQEFDLYLKRVALGTFMISVLFLIGVLIA